MLHVSQYHNVVIYGKNKPKCILFHECDPFKCDKETAGLSVNRRNVGF